jgi:hypothetical protein
MRQKKTQETISARCVQMNPAQPFARTGDLIARKSSRAFLTNGKQKPISLHRLLWFNCG